MSTVSSMSLFFVATLQQQRFQPDSYQFFPALHKREPTTHFYLSIFPSCVPVFLRTWFHKAQTAIAQSVYKTSFHTAPQGSITPPKQPPLDCQNFPARDPQPSCSTCGLPANASCPCCEDKFCHTHIYQCRECQISFCGDCLDLHSLEGHWSDSDTARAMVDSIHRCSSFGQPMYEQSSTRHNQSTFTINRFTNSAFTSPSSPSSSFPASVRRNSRSCSWRSTIHALLRRIHTRNYLAHSARCLLSIFAPFSLEVAQ